MQHSWLTFRATKPIPDSSSDHQSELASDVSTSAFTLRPLWLAFQPSLPQYGGPPFLVSRTQQGCRSFEEWKRLPELAHLTVISGNIALMRNIESYCNDNHSCFAFVPSIADLLSSSSFWISKPKRLKVYQQSESRNF
ncbi:hypothetical protein AVEN_176674-1 [Araneus ventricosus]|uniref:Uncharacterized protein n=1 Tax=Araneus ventricosus TaxID=182803 RepID=A0A4Y2WET4_ARAVE|nr:hypothetical protein AVEN_176674-1 [Araneus ventricosus]